MQELIQTASTALLEPAEISEGQLERLLGSLLGPGIDYGDLYFELSRSEGWSLEDSIVKEGSHSIDRGVGIRAVSGEKTGFAYSDDLSRLALGSAVKAARAVSRSGQVADLRGRVSPPAPRLYVPADPLIELADADKVRRLAAIDDFARSLDRRVTQVMASLAGSYQVVLVMASDGTFAADIRPLVRFNVSVIVEDKGRREQAYSGFGGRYDYSTLLAGERPEEAAREAVRQATLNLEAVDAPAGTMTVVLGSGWPGVLLHEAIGHGLEGDFNRKQVSAFSGRLGQQVASSECTVVDDGTMPGRRGSLNIDDEGTPSSCTTLIQDGILQSYMQDKLNGRLMGGASTGNGRRESFAHLPMPRMTNTYMLAGPHEPEEIISSVKRGLYARNFGGGQVDITSGKFVFSANEAYLIENGRVTAPVKGATLIGNGPDVLTRVSMVGDDLALDPGIGVCGKEGQSVPVGVGQPTLKVDGLTVGGTT